MFEFFSQLQTSPEVCLPTCPETVCTKDVIPIEIHFKNIFFLICMQPLKFDGAGKLVNPGQYGDWTTTCGKTYVNYKTSVNNMPLLFEN